MRLPCRTAAVASAARAGATPAGGIVAACLLVIGLAGCGPEPQATPNATSPGPRVVVTTPILGSVVSQILECAGQGSMEVLMPNGTDPHDFTPSSAQIADLVSADLVIANGLGLESGMQAAFASATADGGRIWEVGPEVDPIPFAEPDSAHADETAHANEPAHEHGTLDPHFWFDMRRMTKAAGLIGEQIQEAAGRTGAESDTGQFTRCGEQAAAEISRAEAGIRATFETIPAERRLLVTDHEALGYLADAYGFQIVGAVIPSMSTMAEPSSADLANLAGVIRNKGVPAIFTNVSQPARLAQAVAEESGTRVVVVPLYVESLGEPGSPAADYVGMMTENARLISTSLAP